MHYFSGFGLKNEQILFKDILKRGDFVVAGFSYGAQKALEFTKDALKRGERIDTLQLISPAYFNELPKPLKQKELLNFTKNPKAYMHIFYKKALYPATIELEPFKKEPTLGELKELLFYEFKREDLAFLKDNNVVIEVFIGSNDKIILALEIEEFFKPFGTIYMIKRAGHFLKE